VAIMGPCQVRFARTIGEADAEGKVGLVCLNVVLYILYNRIGAAP
jgi:hypothetical protein